MVAILVIIALLIVVAVAVGVSGRRKADERARVEREREVIAGELSGHEQTARFTRTSDAGERHGDLSHHR